MTENIAFLLAGIGLIIYGTVTLLKLKLKRYVKVSAECLDVREEIFYAGDTASSGYKNTFVFHYGGKQYVAQEKNYLGRKLKKGKSYTILIDPHDPTTIMTFPQIANYVFFIVAGVIAIAVSIL